LKGLLKVVIDGQIWIALAATLLTSATYKVFALPENGFLLAFMFCGTLFVYRFHDWVTRAYTRTPALFLLWTAGLAATGILVIFEIRQIPLLILPVLVAMGYSLPVLPSGKRLRDFPLLKVFLIAGVWTYLSAVWPVWAAGDTRTFPLLSFSLERLLFIFALTLPFDIRDLSGDRAEGVLTFPVVWGVRKTKLLSWVALLLYAVLATLHYQWGIYPAILWGVYLLLAALTGLLMQLSTPDKHPWYFTGILDGMLVLQSLFTLWLG